MANSKENQRREQILEAALNVVVEKGYEKSRMDDIVRVSGLSKGAIYWYYKSKKEVYLSLVNHWVFKYSATLNLIVEEDLTASDQLRALFQFFVKQYQHNARVFKALVEFWSLAARDEDFRIKMQKVYTEFLNLIENILAKGVESGEFDPLDTKIAALSIVVNIEGIIWFAIFDVPDVSAPEYIDTISNFILTGLVKNTNGGNNNE
ncbi:MAG: TetR/AcrR family transcriptional regulator [Candidatus Marinimicrobia bacterium]|nr:TetR/AcrR family transcriptional regulator [Candidatus Neomarinimicrobiota bacterium]